MWLCKGSKILKTLRAAGHRIPSVDPTPQVTDTVYPDGEDVEKWGMPQNCFLTRWSRSDGGSGVGRCTYTMIDTHLIGHVKFHGAPLSVKSTAVFGHTPICITCSLVAFWFSNMALETPPRNYVFLLYSPWYMGMGQYLLIPFLVGWTSIYQLFWGSLGTRVLTHPHIGKLFF